MTRIHHEEVAVFQIPTSFPLMRVNLHSKFFLDFGLSLMKPSLATDCTGRVSNKFN